LNSGGKTLEFYVGFSLDQRNWLEVLASEARKLNIAVRPKYLANPGLWSPEPAGHFISFLWSRLKQLLFCSEHLFFSANCFENAQ
jgi:hypothetical protein